VDTSVTPTTVEGSITDQAIETLRQRIGLPVGGLGAGFTEVGRDSLVNYTRGLGDLNPLFRDDSYAEATRWQGLIAHPTMLRYMGARRGSRTQAIAPPPGGWGDPLAGVHAFFSGVTMEFFQPLQVGDTLAVKGGISDIIVKDASKMGGRAIHEIHDKVYWNQRGELVGVTHDLRIRVARAEARSRDKFKDLEVPHHYTPDEIERIDEAYEAEYRRGSEPRYWEDVALGEESIPLAKGPWTLSSYMVFLMGTGLLRGMFHFANSEAYQHRKRHPRAFPPNELGIPVTVAAVHHSRDLARNAGIPETYDAGAERVAAASHAVTNWMGDDSFLRRLQVSLRGFVFNGDVYYIGCRVTDKYQNSEGAGVRLEIAAHNQRDERVIEGSADVLLPTRERGPVRVPVVPAEQFSIFEESTV
jgi:acyl dehydratase